jgi:hypothetical protein
MCVPLRSARRKDEPRSQSNRRAPDKSCNEICRVDYQINYTPFALRCNIFAATRTLNAGATLNCNCFRSQIWKREVHGSFYGRSLDYNYGICSDVLFSKPFRSTNLFVAYF